VKSRKGITRGESIGVEKKIREFVEGGGNLAEPRSLTQGGSGGIVAPVFREKTSTLSLLGLHSKRKLGDKAPKGKQRKNSHVDLHKSRKSFQESSQHIRRLIRGWVAGKTLISLSGENKSGYRA